MPAKPGSCEHPADSVRMMWRSCGCCDIKCFGCSLTYTHQCKGHGRGIVKTVGARK